MGAPTFLSVAGLLHSGGWEGFAVSPTVWLRRALTWLHLPSGLTVVYHPRYQRRLLDVPLDPQRGDKILAFLGAEGFLGRKDIFEPRPVSLKNLLRVHSVEYLQSLQEPEALTRILGVGVPAGEAEQILDLQRLLVGGTIHATRLALRSGGTAVHLGGGFHHALPEAGMGFCVFNDVAVAIARLRARGYAERILVVDLDLHDGNGTRRIFADDPTVHTYSLHSEHWGERDAVESTAIALGHQVGDAVYLEAIRSTLPGVFESFRPGLVFYLAGADPAADDRLGDWSVSAEALLARDQIVAELARGRGRRVPLVVLLAGGYGHRAWRYPARFLSWLASGRSVEPPADEEVILDRLRRIGRTLSPAELSAEPDDGLAFRLSEEDLPGLHGGAPTPTRYIGCFSRHGVELLLERVGILDELRVRGFRSLQVRLDLNDTLGHTLRVVSAGPPEELLIELRLDRTRRAIPGLELLSLEWLLLQNPRGAFTPHRPRLPGQQHPGLGLLREVFGLLVVVCETQALDGLYFQVAHYHVAVLGQRFLRCLRPEDEARFRAFSETLAGLSLAEAARAIIERRLVQADTGAPAEWQPSPMVLPVSAALTALVQGPEFEAQVAEQRDRFRLRLLTPATAQAG